MPDPQDKRPVQVSLLDRLTDDDPDHEQESPLSGKKLERMIREGMRRDIEGFLNTRRRCVPVPASLTDAAGSVVDYGVPDFVGRTLSSDRRRKQFLRTIEECLRRHEPRFKSVHLEMLGAVDEAERSFHFRIDAVVYADPAPESLMFDSRVEPVSRTFRVKA